MNQKHEYSTFGRHVAYVIAANIVTLVLGFVRTPILTKGLGANLYGTWSLINVTISLLVPFAMLTLHGSIVRFLAAEKDEHKVREDFFSACAIVLLSGSVFSLILFFLSDYLAVHIFKAASSSSYIRLSSVLILINAFYPVLLSFFRMRRKIGMYTSLSLSNDVLQVTLIVAAILLGHRLGGVITATIISGILIILVIVFTILRQTGFQLPQFSNIKSYLKWGIPLTPNSALMWIIVVSDRYLVSYFQGVSAVGVYSAAYVMGQYASFAVMPLGLVLYPTISKTYDEKNFDETRNYLKYSNKFLMMITIPSAFGLSILAKPLLSILTTSEFVTGSNVVSWVAFGSVIYCFAVLNGYIIQLVGKTYISLWLLAIAAILNVALNLIMIPRMGIIGAAIATLVAYTVLGILTLLITRRYLKYDLNLSFVARSILASAVMMLCIWLINPISIFMIIVSIITGIVTYFGILFLLRGFKLQELRFFASFVKHASVKK